MTEKLTRFPEGLDTPDELPNIKATDREYDEGLEHDVVHTAANQAIREIQKKLGKNEDPNPESIDFRIAKLEKSGGGGSGLTLGDDDTPLAGENENIEVPAHPSVWLEAVVNGERFVVPAYKVGELLALEDFVAETAALFRPVLFRAHEYHPFIED